MKHFKHVVMVLCVIVITFSTFAQSAERLHPVDIRSVALGANYLTDTESVYSLFTNPAAIAFTGDKTLFPGLSVLSGGRLLEIVDLANLIGNGINVPIDLDSDDINDTIDAIDKFNTFFNDVDTFIGEDGYNASARIGGPLTFGAIINNFGWGFVNTIDVGAKLNINGDLISFDIPENLGDLNDLLTGEVPDFSDITGLPEVPGMPEIPELPDTEISLVATTDVNLDAVVGYAVPLDLGLFGQLSFGVSARGITQVSFLYKDDMESLFLNDSNVDIDSILSHVPAAFSVGLGIDMGVQYRVLDMVNVALVWQDIYSPIWTNSVLSVTDIGTLFDDGGNGYTYSVLDSQLGLGASVDIPLEKITGNVISHAAAYANYSDFLQLVRNSQSSMLVQNPLLDLAVGAEVVLYETVAFRLGMNQLFPSGGIGVYLGPCSIDFSVHNEELGYQGEDWKQLNFGLSVSFQK